MTRSERKWEVGSTLLVAMVLDVLGLYSLFQVAMTGELLLHRRGVTTIAEGSLAWVLSFVILSLGGWCSYRAYRLWRASAPTAP